MVQKKCTKHPPVSLSFNQNFKIFARIRYTRLLKSKKSSLKKPCRGFYVSQNILPTSFEIDQIQNIIDIGNWLLNFQEVE
jgi:hypothetical protein